jgi:outer membrane protein TolC
VLRPGFLSFCSLALLFPVASVDDGQSAPQQRGADERVRRRRGVRDALLSDRLVTIAEATHQQAEETLRQTAVMRKVGTLPEFDVLRARVSLQGLRPPDDMPAAVPSRVEASSEGDVRSPVPGAIENLEANRRSIQIAGAQMNIRR